MSKHSIEESTVRRIVREEYVQCLYESRTLSDDDLDRLVIEGVLDEAWTDWLKGAGKVAKGAAAGAAKAVGGAAKGAAQAAKSGVAAGVKKATGVATAAGEKVMAAGEKVTDAAKQKYADVVAQVAHQAAQNMEQGLKAQVQKLTPQLVQAFLKQGLDDSMAAALAKDAIKRAVEESLKDIVATTDKVAVGVK